MKRAIFLLVCGLATIVIYNILMIWQYPLGVPFIIGDIIVCIIAFIFLVGGITDGYPKTLRFITPPRKPVYRVMNPSILGRAVRDGPEGAEHMVHGHEETTFREACIADWQFKYVDRKSDWIVVSDKGNDVSSEPLSRFDGVFTLIGHDGTDESHSSTDEFTSIDDGVEYYD